MDTYLSHHRSLSFLPSHLNSIRKTRGGNDYVLIPSRRKLRYNSMVVVAASGASLDAPLVPRTAQGRFLTTVLVKKRQLFHFAVADLLKQLADDKEAALSRMFVSSGSDEASLHRRIAQLKESDCQTAIEDIMYMLILYKFSEIRVPLVPKLPTCIYNGRLEIWPSKDWELESIHSCDVLELIKEHSNAVISLRVNSTLTDNCATTEIDKHHLSKVYTASILYGYFLKSASLRHQLECSLSQHTGSFTKQLRHYISGFDPKILQRCAKPRSHEAKNLIEKQSLALFGPKESNEESIVTSFSSLKRLLLEAVAFGTFLFDTEEYVDGAFKLKENENAEEEENSSV
ncbi:UV-B-induced protein [Cardamine amara subsp. amara]|uniref:UV-B-induced protein n=1 Tax=Cardamine amara subsp. amara TaxID=228776 RepID=A0ABD1B6C6_CARAN